VSAGPTAGRGGGVQAAGTTGRRGSRLATRPAIRLRRGIPTGRRRPKAENQKFLHPSSLSNPIEVNGRRSHAEEQTESEKLKKLRRLGGLQRLGPSNGRVALTAKNPLRPTVGPGPPAPGPLLERVPEPLACDAPGVAAEEGPAGSGHDGGDRVGPEPRGQLPPGPTGPPAPGAARVSSFPQPAPPTNVCRPPLLPLPVPPTRQVLIYCLCWYVHATKQDETHCCNLPLLQIIPRIPRHPNSSLTGAGRRAQRRGGNRYRPFR